MTVSADVRFRPRPPARVDRSMTKRLNCGRLNRSTAAVRMLARVFPSSRSYLYPGPDPSKPPLRKSCANGTDTGTRMFAGDGAGGEPMNCYTVRSKASCVIPLAFETSVVRSWQRWRRCVKRDRVVMASARTKQYKLGRPTSSQSFGRSYRDKNDELEHVERIILIGQ